ncbi:hypothetical protein EDD86DRAFT_54682 [Gorgonomyces haynaldii]|nr:hypothetical protein EDD86DRAFT_54682 [Gorgonomyces haynaldii]
MQRDIVQKSVFKRLDLALKPFVPVVERQFVKPGGHFCLFPPMESEQELRTDGYESGLAPPYDQYKHVMWVGGDIRWHQHLMHGDAVEQDTKMDIWTEKSTGRGPAVFTTLRKQIYKQDLALEEMRTLVYLNSPHTGHKNIFKKSVPVHQLQLLPSRLLLFRFSALTWNSHRIHYDQEYCQKVEQYQDLLVPGPLTCTLLLEFFTCKYPHLNPASFSYQATSPLFVDKPMTLNIQERQSDFELWANNDQGGLAMKGILQVNA